MNPKLLQDLLMVAPMAALFLISLIPLTIKVLNSNREPKAFFTLIYGFIGLAFAIGLTASIDGTKKTAFSNAIIMDGVSAWGSYLVYGITNGSKWLDKRATLTDFLKFVVVDLRVLFQKMDNQQIVLQTGSASNFSRIEGGKMTIPINQNPDFSSSFVAFDVRQLQQLFGNDGIIFSQKGFF